MSSELYWRTALGALPNAANAQVGHTPPASRYSMNAGQENAPIPLDPAAPEASRKRKSTAEHLPAQQVDVHAIDLDDMPIDENCDQVRRKIRALLDSGAMTKTAFAREIGVSTNSLTGFLSTSGPFNGAGSAAYGAAWAFLKSRELSGVRLPVKKQKTGVVAGGHAVQGGRATGGAAAAVDLSGIVLPGEDEDAVPVFDTCDEVRRKISAHLKKTSVTKAQFCRDVYAQLRGPCRPGKPFQSAQLDRFRNAKGPRAGVSSSFFYAAYVFFEKMRIREGKPKSKHRLEMEQVWGPEGIDRKHDGRSGFWCHKDEHPYMDRYGQLRFY